ncbi:MAG: FliH/SctL family protein [Mobilitalea sp.]
MIKAYSVRYEEGTTKTIDTHLKHFVEPMIEVLKPVSVSIEAKDDFIEGLKALVVEQIPTKEEEENSSKIVEDAHTESKLLIEQAKKEAERLKNEVYATAQKNGYDDGLSQAKLELVKMKTEYEEKTKKLQIEYEKMAQEMEPKMAEIIGYLVEKMTGIIIEDKEDVIMFLVSRALKNVDKSDEYTIKVSKDDYDYVSSRNPLLLEAIGRDVKIFVTEDSNLKKNQCLIETDLRAIDCSLDVQLKNLILDIKLLSGI